MTRCRKVLLVMIALALLSDLLPVTRDELSWRWALFCDHASDYQRYMTDWPKGRHTTDAKVLCQKRQYDEAKKVLIRQAYELEARHLPNSDAAYRREQLTRQDDFFWKLSSAVNTVEGYRQYLKKYPGGRHYTEAERNIQGLLHSAMQPVQAGPT